MSSHLPDGDSLPKAMGLPIKVLDLHYTIQVLLEQVVAPVREEGMFVDIITEVIRQK